MVLRGSFAGGTHKHVLQGDIIAVIRAARVAPSHQVKAHRNLRVAQGMTIGRK